MEEIYNLIENCDDEKTEGMLLGIVRHHLKHCNEETCLYLKNYILYGNSLSSKIHHVVNKLILSKFTKLIKNNSKDMTKLSIFIIKFMSYLTIADVNPIKCYYEIQKIIHHSELHQNSFYSESLLQYFRKKIKHKIMTVHSQKSFNDYNNGKKDMSPSEFFRISKTQNALEKQLKELIKAKKIFWEDYEKGITSMEELIDMLIILSQRIKQFSSLLIDNSKSMNPQPFNLLKLKYSSILHSLLYNDIGLARKYEEEYEAIIIKSQIHEEDMNLHNLSFIDSNTVVCLVSYLQSEGLLKEDCKTDKLASFFGYSPQEIKPIKTLTPLMPYYIAIYHNQFVQRFFQRSKKGLKRTASSLNTFALNKKEFVFEIRIFYGFNFDYKDDFVLMAAMMKKDDEGDYIWLSDHMGNTKGVSENLFLFYKKHYDYLKKSDMNLLNVFSLVPELRDFFDKLNEEKVQDFKNKACLMIMPEKMDEIIKYIGAITKEEVNIEINEASKSIKSFKTVKSSKSENTSRKTAFKIPKILTTLFKKKYQEKIFEGCDDINEAKRRIFDVFITKGEIKKFIINFDLSLQTHHYGTENTEFIKVLNLKIKKIEEDFLNTEVPKSNRIDNQLDSSSNQDEKEVSANMKGLGSLLPEENEPKFKNIFGKELISSSIEEIPKVIKPKMLIDSEIEKNQEKLNDFFPKLITQKIGATIKNFKDKNMTISNSPNQRELFLNKDKTQRSSSIMEAKLSNLVFNSIHNIQKVIPRALKLFSMTLILEVCFILTYFSVLYTLYVGYVTQSYTPIQKSMINYCRLSTSLSYSTAIFTEIEYQSFNLTTRTLSPMKKKLFNDIMSQNYLTLKNINFIERNMPGDNNYQNIYKEVSNLFIDYQTYEIKTIKYADNIDFYLNLIYLTINDFNLSLPMNQQIILQRNYPYFLPSTSVIYLAVLSDFTQSNVGTTKNAMYIMLVFLIISVLLKIFQTFQLLKFHKTITNIMNIFRRVNLQDSVNEKNFYHEIYMILHQPFLRFSFIEKCLNKRVFMIEELQQQGNTSKTIRGEKMKISKNKRRIKAKSGFYNVKPLPKKKIIIFMMVLCFWSVVFYFFNYYYWVINNENINNLIRIDIFFINVYVYSTSILGFNTVALRERVVRNYDYEKLNDIYQNHDQRLDYFYSGLIERLYLIGNISAESLPQYTLYAKDELNNKDFNQLVSGDICELLFRKGIIEETVIGFCRSSFDGAFNKGIMNLVNEFLEQIKQLLSYTQVIDKMNIEKNKEQRENVRNFINSQNYEDFIYAYYFYHNTLLIYYEFINDYYQEVMDKQMYKLYSFIIATSFVSGFLMLLLMVYGYRKMISYYRDIALGLSIIPYDKISNDEQIKFLINNFLKEIN